MTASLDSPSLFLMVTVGATACFLPDLQLEGRQCPCAAGYSCNTATNTCVSGDGSTSTVPPDATSTGPGTGGSGAPSGPGGAPSLGGGGAVGDGGFATGGDGSGGSPITDGTCGSPIPIADPGGVVSTNIGQGNDMPTACYDADGPDVVFSVTAAITGTMELTLYSQAELFFYARSDCLDGASELFCIDDNGTNSIEFASLPVTQGQTIYVIVDGHGGEESDFTLDVATSP